MGKSYTHLSNAERGVICYMRKSGFSYRQIGAELGRDPSSVCREFNRNSRPTKQWSGGYDADRAHQLALRRRRWDARFKMARQPALRDRVKAGLAMGWSPEQVSGRLALEDGRKVISHESIYRYIYHRTAQKDYWHRLLPCARFQRGWRGRKGGSSAKTIRDRVSLEQRPKTAEDRKQAGHWEGDLMVCKGRQNILVTCERTSRLILIHHHPTKEASPIADRLIGQFAPLPASLRRSISFDNGTEFAEHWRLNKTLSMATFFCDTHSPWQKGGVENAIGRLRRVMPRRCDLSTLTLDDIRAVAKRYNATPRKCLGYQTPAEVFTSFLNPLHFNREFIFPPSRE